MNTNTQRPRAIQPNKITETVYYSPQEVAEMLHVSTKTVVRRFSEVPGVVDIGTPETRTKKRVRLLRIPASVLNRFIAERQVAA